MDNDFIDVHEYIENGSEARYKNGILYYSSGQVAEILGITKSKLNYYVEIFKDCTDIETVNTHRKYTEDNIDFLQDVLELKKQGMPLKLIKKYKMEIKLKGEEVVLPEKSPLAVDVLAQALLKEQDKKLDIMQENIISTLKQYIEQNNMNTILTIDENIQTMINSQEKLKEDILDNIKIQNQDFKTYIDQKELDFKAHDEKIIDILRTGMRDAELKNENESKKGFWSRIFNKNK